jgi:GrpB-like predicted nucleotidyltransferase (UPF0157 family)
MTEPSPDPVGLPAWAVEGVHLSAYDPQWARLAAQYADELQPVLGRWLLGPVEHVGSTSVPGLTAKPVIDLMAQAADPGAVVSQAGAELSQRGWSCVPPEFDQRTFRRFFVKVSPDGEHRLAHLHLMFAGTGRWAEQLRFRDALRADPALRDEYAAVKSRLASAHAGDRERYTDAKGAFVVKALRDLGGPADPN